MVRQLTPWFENLGKRQVKAPKVYIRDSGLLHALLGISSLRDLEHHPKVGASWEGYAVEEVLKALRPDETYYWATHGGAEIDLLLFKDGRRIGVECKRGRARTHAFHAHRVGRPGTRRTSRRLSRREALCTDQESRGRAPVAACQCEVRFELTTELACGFLRAVAQDEPLAELDFLSNEFGPAAFDLGQAQGQHLAFLAFRFGDAPAQVHLGPGDGPRLAELAQLREDLLTSTSRSSCMSRKVEEMNTRITRSVSRRPGLPVESGFGFMGYCLHDEKKSMSPGEPIISSLEWSGRRAATEKRR